MAGSFELVTKLVGVVELAVIGNPDVARLVAKGLVGLRGEIDDAKPGVSQHASGTRTSKGLHAARVGAAVVEGIQTTLHALAESVWLRGYDAKDPAHLRSSVLIFL
jgi:hypothetical protein